MSGAAPQPVHGDTVSVQPGDSFSSTVPNGVVGALGLDGDSRLRWRFDPDPADEAVDPYTGEAAVNRSGPSSLEATIPAWVRRGMGIGAEARLNWHCEGEGGPAKVLVVGREQPPATVYVADA